MLTPPPPPAGTAAASVARLGRHCSSPAHICGLQGRASGCISRTDSSKRPQIESSIAAICAQLRTVPDAHLLRGNSSKENEKHLKLLSSQMACHPVGRQCRFFLCYSITARWLGLWARPCTRYGAERHNRVRGFHALPTQAPPESNIIGPPFFGGSSFAGGAFALRPRNQSSSGAWFQPRGVAMPRGKTPRQGTQNEGERARQPEDPRKSPPEGGVLPYLRRRAAAVGCACAALGAQTLRRTQS